MLKSVRSFPGQTPASARQPPAGAGSKPGAVHAGRSSKHFQRRALLRLFAQVTPGARMIRASIILADFADSDAAKFTFSGPDGPRRVPSQARGPWSASSRSLRKRPGGIAFTLRLTDRAGDLVEVQGPTGAVPFELSGRVEVREPEEWDGATELSAAFSVSVTTRGVICLASMRWGGCLRGRDRCATDDHHRCPVRQQSRQRPCVPALQRGIAAPASATGSSVTSHCASGRPSARHWCWPAGILGQPSGESSHGSWRPNTVRSSRP